MLAPVEAKTAHRFASAPGRLSLRYARCAVAFAGLAWPALFPRGPRLKHARRGAD